jgi:hypothetical protein
MHVKIVVNPETNHVLYALTLHAPDLKMQLKSVTFKFSPCY